MKYWFGFRASRAHFEFGYTTKLKFCDTEQIAVYSFILNCSAPVSFFNTIMLFPFKSTRYPAAEDDVVDMFVGPSDRNSRPFLPRTLLFVCTGRPLQSNTVRKSPRVRRGRRRERKKLLKKCHRPIQPFSFVVFLLRRDFLFLFNICIAS